MSQNKIIIIGAGVAGLCAGSYLQMNNYDTNIFELHNMPGGLCTGWKRNGYTFDGCVHSLSGTNPEFRLYTYWNELIDMKSMKFHFFEELVQYEDENGTSIKISCDPDMLEQELKSIAPEDTKFINAFIKAIKKFTKYDFTMKKPIELWNPLDYYVNQFRTAPVLKYLIKWRKSIQETAEKCKSPVLKKLLVSDFYSHFPAYFLLMSIAHLHIKNAGFPIEGSLHLAHLLEQKYLSLGGKVHYNSRVTKINIMNDRATGITLENGEVHDADIVISAADGYDTIYKMLEGKYVDKKLQKFYDKHPRFPSLVIISLGVARTFEDEPSLICLGFKEPIIVDNKSKHDRLDITIYNFDPTLAPEGKTCMRVLLETQNFDYWNDLRANNKLKYDKEKARIANDVIKILNERFKNIQDDIEVVDVATPATLNRYTNNWQGSFEGFEWTPGVIPKMVKKELPGLKNFYMIGQWVMPGGGLPTCLLTGRDITRIICKRTKRKFQTQ